MNFKEATQEAILRYYDRNGLKKTIAFSKELLKSQKYKNDFEFISSLHGEICETILEITLTDYMKKNPDKTKDWSIFKGLILKDRTNLQSPFFTELDLTLFTPHEVYLFECKSYSGDKTLTGDGLLKRTLHVDTKDSVKTCNVYSQSCVHRDTISKWIIDFVMPGKSSTIQMCMFDFSLGNLEDKRSRAAKIEMPCLNVDNVIKYVTSFDEIVWDAKCLKVVGDKLVKLAPKLTDKHLSYVKSLHGGR